MRAIILLFILLNLLQANQKVILQLSWLNQFQFAGYYMAIEKGYYNDVGIDLEIKEFEFGMDLSTVIEDKNVDFVIGRSSILIDKSKGKDIVALFSTFQNSPLILLTKKDSNINSLEDLKNKNLMITSDAKNTASILAMLNSRNIHESNINIQAHSFNINDLIDGKTDAMASYLSNEPIILDNREIKYKIFNPKDYGFSFYDDILFTTSAYINQNPKLTKDFFDATIKGWKYAFENIGKTSQVIYDKYNTQNKSLIQLVREGEILKKLAVHDDINSFGNIDGHKLRKITDVYKVMGLMQNDIDIEKFVYNFNNGSIVDVHFTKNQLIEYSLVAIIVVLILIFTTIYIMIRRKLLLTTNALKKEVEEKTRQIKELSYIDSLTNAKNRRAYTEKMEESISLFNRYKTKFSMLYMDIDDFKRINDTYGHKIGDKVLIELVNIIKSRLRNNDTLYRVGGEEFVILFFQTNLEQAKIVAEDVRQLVEENLNINNKIVTISSGLTEVKEEDTEEYMYKRADMLLYKSKTSGKNRISY